MRRHRLAERRKRAAEAPLRLSSREARIGSPANPSNTEHSSDHVITPGAADLDTSGTSDHFVDAEEEIRGETGHLAFPEGVPDK